MRYSSLFSIVLFFVSTAVASDNWPQFRGPDGEGRADSRGVPLTWSEQEPVRWKTAIPGKGWSSPVVWGDQIWISTAFDDGKSLRAICVGRDDGKIVHDLELFAPEKPLELNPKNSHASPTPVIEEGRVYVCFGSNGMACVDTRTGKTLWKNTELKVDHEVGPGSSPIPFGDLLLLNCDGTDVRYVAAVDKFTGKIAWRTDRSGEEIKRKNMRKAFSVPLVIDVNGQALAVSPGADRAVAYDALTGREEWFVRYPGGFSNVPRPVSGHGLVYVITGYTGLNLWAIRPDGHGDVTDTHIVWRVSKQVSANPSPVLVGDELFMVSDQGVATCLDAKTGEELWKERISGKYSASPVAVDGRIYFFDEDGRTTVVKSARKFELLATNQLDGGFMASAAVVGKAFVLRTDSNLYRIEE